MADPFSILVGTAGLLDICIRATAYLVHIKEAAGKVEEDIAALTHDIEALVAVNESIAKYWKRYQSAVPPGTKAEDADRIQDTWKNVGINLRDCQGTVEKMSLLLEGIIGKDGVRGLGKLNGLRRALRKQSKEGDFEKLRRELADYRASLHLLFTTLNFSHVVCSQVSTDHLSENFEHLRFRLQSEIALLRPRLGSVDGNANTIRDSINSAIAVTSIVSLNKHFYIPQSVSSIWTGRKALLDELKDALDGSSPTERSHTQKRFVLYGLGGSGKTQFCCKFAQDNRKDFWGIFWIDASSEESANHTFSNIAKIGGVDPNIAAAKVWLSNQERPWLLVIDNADADTDGADSDGSIEKYFPEGERGVILVTTRNPDHRWHGTIGSRFYHFEMLEIEEANDLLLKAACEPIPYRESSRESATLITKELGCLPLALVHAGKAIRHRLCSLANYLNFYKKNWQRIRQTRSEDTNVNVYSSYEIIYQSLEGRKTQESRDAIDLLKMFSFLHYENIRVEFLNQAATNPKLEQQLQEREIDDNDTKIVSILKTWILHPKKVGFWLLEATLRDRSRPVLPKMLRSLEALSSFDDLRLRITLKELSQMSLITEHEPDSYHMHPLVHTWVRERPGMSTGEQAIWCEAATTILARCILLPPLGSTAADVAMRRDLLPHVVHVQKCRDETCAQIEENQTKRNRPWPVLTPRFDRQHAIILAKFSRVYSQCGHWIEAEKLQLRVKNFIVPLLGPEHPRSIDIMLALSGTIWQQSRFNEAADLQEQVYQTCINSMGPYHLRTLQVADILGASRCHQGRFWEAKELHEKAITGMITALGVEHQDSLVAQDHLGKVLFWLFHYEEAKELHYKAHAGLEKVLGPNHLKTLDAKENLALTYLEIGGELLDTAHKIMEEVVTRREQTLGKEQAWTLAARLNLARVKCALNQATEVEQMLREGIPIAQRNLGENHFGTLAALHFFGQFLVRQKRYDEAQSILLNVIERQRYSLGAQKDGHHPDRLMAMYHLVGCYQLQGKIEEAIRLCDQVYLILEERKSIHRFAQWVREKKEELRATRSACANEIPVVEHSTVEEFAGQPEGTVFVQLRSA